MRLYPFITWYPEDKSVVRGHGLGEDVYYLSGNRPARYPVPAIPVRVGWMPESSKQQFPSSYWWICSTNMLWSCFEKWGLVVERS